GGASADDVARVAGVALTEDDLPRLEGARHRDGGHAVELARPERLEHGHARKQVGGELLAGLHASAIPQTVTRSNGVAVRRGPARARARAAWWPARRARSPVPADPA